MTLSDVVRQGVDREIGESFVITRVAWAGRGSIRVAPDEGRMSWWRTGVSAAEPIFVPTISDLAACDWELE